MINIILLILITLIIPPIGVALVAGCGADLLINILLTILGYFPGHIHAFYIEYQYFKRRGEARAGGIVSPPAPGVYSNKVQSGGYGTFQPIPQPIPQQAPPPGPIVR